MKISYVYLNYKWHNISIKKTAHIRYVIVIKQQIECSQWLRRHIYIYATSIYMILRLNDKTSIFANISWRTSGIFDVYIWPNFHFDKYSCPIGLKIKRFMYHAKMHLCVKFNEDMSKVRALCMIYHPDKQTHKLLNEYTYQDTNFGK